MHLVKKLFYSFFFVYPIYINSNNEFLEYPLFELEKDSIKIFTYNELKSLKKNLPPTYIYYYDWEQYQERKKVLKKGILFTYRNLIAKKVGISGNFSNWKLVPMKRNDYGIFYYIHKLEENNRKNLKEYYYKFFVDGIWLLDPINPNKEFNNSEEVSYFYFEDQEKYYLTKTEVLNKKSSTHPILPDYYEVEFKIHEIQLKRILNKKEIHSVSIVGNFNYWNPYSNFLKKDEKGIYRWKTNLPKGTYYYNFIVDGEWILDPLNEDSKYLQNFNKLFSYINLE